MVEKVNVQFDNFVDVFEKYGVQVDCLILFQWNQVIGIFDFCNDLMMMCMFFWDILFIIGSEIMVLVNLFCCWYFEYLVYWFFMNFYFEDDLEFKWIQVLCLCFIDKSYKYNYYDEWVLFEECFECIVVKDFVMMEVEFMWDVVDVMWMGKDFFIQYGLMMNWKLMEWFKCYYFDFCVYVVNFFGDLYLIYIDVIFVLFCLGFIINNLNCLLLQEQRKIFEVNDWQIVDVVQLVYDMFLELCYLFVWLLMNCLVFDLKMVICEVLEVYQMEQMDKLGMNVILVVFCDVYLFGGGFYCVMVDVYCEGICEDYFLNQVDDLILV